MKKSTVGLKPGVPCRFGQAGMCSLAPTRENRAHIEEEKKFCRYFLPALRSHGFRCRYVHITQTSCHLWVDSLRVFIRKHPVEDAWPSADYTTGETQEQNALSQKRTICLDKKKAFGFSERPADTFSAVF